MLAETVSSGSCLGSSNLDQQDSEKRLAAIAADIEFLHRRLTDVVDDVTRLFNLRNDVAQSVNQLHQTLMNA